MCGIVGQVTVGPRQVDRRQIETMNDRLRHRGPDDSGVIADGTVGLGHRRLSILDLSPAGRQPMANEAGTLWIVFNGEIYNFEELRAALKRPRTFRSRTDTEVLLYLYEDYGEQCFSMLRGMFALAIWDAPAQRLVLARDRVGKKPLFYRVEEGGLTFASELKALVVDARPDIDPVSLHHYLTFQYVPSPRTIFKQIYKLLPGHVLVYERGKATSHAYWTLQYGARNPGRSEQDYLEEFQSLWREAVQLRLISDVPLGAFLSGGLDSSSVVATMSRLQSRPVRTFSIGFKDDAYNELPHAREVARHCGTDHHEFVVEPSAVDILQTLVHVYDEPFADSSAIPTYYVSKLSREFVTVVLNGDGGDELFAGYPRYQFAQAGPVATQGIPSAIRRGLARRVARISPRWRGTERMRRGLERLAEPVTSAYFNRICYFSTAEKELLYQDDFHETVCAHDSYDLMLSWFGEAKAATLLDQLLAVDTRSYLPDDLLVKVDRATMAHGLEARSPFLDHKLVEFAAALPDRLKVRAGMSKYLLKTAMRGVLPDRIIDRQKQGFGVPIDRWFREDCREFVRDTLLSSRSLARGYFKPERITELVDRHQEGAGSYGYRLYALVMLELWHQAYQDGATVGDRLRACAA